MRNEMRLRVDESWSKKPDDAHKVPRCLGAITVQVLFPGKEQRNDERSSIARTRLPGVP